MRNLARQLDPSHITQTTGSVVRVDGTGFVVRTDTGDTRARRAASCLLQPEVGDFVLLAILPAGAGYVLAVLDREEGAPARIAVDGDLEVKLPHGRFTVAAQEGVGLLSGKELSIVSDGLDMTAQTGRVVLDRLSLFGTLVQAELQKAKLVAGELEAALERLSHRVKRSHRFVEGLDEVRAEPIDDKASTTVSLHARSGRLTSESPGKVARDQLHLG
jgi:hypothetical protein